MSRNYVLTLSGPDRVGIVEEVTGLVLARGGNVEASRMARLGGEFTALMLINMTHERADGFEDEFELLIARGYRITIAHSHAKVQPHEGWAPYRIAVEGADHEGIIHEVSRHLAEHGISIEEMESDCTLASTSAVPLFSMRAHVLVPPGADPGWIGALEQIGWKLNVEIDVADQSKS